MFEENFHCCSEEEKISSPSSCLDRFVFVGREGVKSNRIQKDFYHLKDVCAPGANLPGAQFTFCQIGCIYKHCYRELTWLTHLYKNIASLKVGDVRTQKVSISIFQFLIFYCSK